MRDRNASNEKAKDFKSAITRLFKELKSFKVLITIALVLAALGSVLSIFAPNKLSSLTDEISKGLVINTNNLTKLTTSMNLTEEMDMNSIVIKDTTIDNVFISSLDQTKFLTIMSSVNKDTSTNELYSKMDEMPESIQKLIKPTMNIDSIKNIALFLACLYVISALFNYIESIVMTNVSNNFAKNLRNRISNKINKLPLKYFDKNSYGDV